MKGGPSLYQRVMLSRHLAKHGDHKLVLKYEQEKDRRANLRNDFFQSLELIKNIESWKPLETRPDSTSPRTGSQASLAHKDLRQVQKDTELKMSFQRNVTEHTAMAFRTSRIFKALDKHDAETPAQVRDLLAAGDDAEMVDASTGRGFVHKIVELFEAPREDEFLESQMMPSLISLVSAGANVNLRDTDGNSPLHLAFILDSGAKVINMLVKLGADLTILNESGQKVGDLITRNTDPHMVKSLGAMVPGLWHAMEEDDYEKVVNMLENWSKIDVSVDGVSLIDRAKEKGNEKIINSLQDTKKMKKILKKEKIDLESKDLSLVDEDGGQVEMTVLGECLMLNLFESAKFLLEKGAFINEPIKVGNEMEPVYFYLMKNNPSLVFSPIFVELIEKADLKLIKRFTVGILFTAYTNAWPTEVIDKLVECGLDVTARSEDGFSLRDNLLVQVAFYPRKKRLEKMQFVDQHILKLASEGNLERLTEIMLSGYSNINVRDQRGRPATYLAKKEGHKEVAELIDSVSEKFANLAKAREYLTEESAFMRDRAGRSSLHIAVLFERRFVIKYLLKSYPSTVHIKDDNGRTSMHYACALQDGADIEDVLSQQGADDTAQDDFKRCPMDYKLNDDENFIEAEKQKTCAFNIYLLEVYLNFADGIIEDDFDLVRDTRDDLYEDVKMADILPKMYKNIADKPPSLLQLCIDNRRENIARYLINNGVDMWEDVVFDEKVMKFPLAVEKAEMTRLNDFLSKKRREDVDEDAKFKAAEKTIKEAKANWIDDSSKRQPDAKSKSCTIL